MNYGNVAMTAPFRLRPARPDESADLSELMLRSKAHWGYGPDFMAKCVEALTFTPERIANGQVMAAQCDRTDDLFGVCEVVSLGRHASLEKLFVDPQVMGLGVGRALFDWAAQTAADAGCESMVIESDPDAEAFYERMGARRVGEAPSEVIPGRMLPMMVYRIPGH